MENSIKIKKKYLIFRSDINEVFKNITQKKNIHLDFSQVKFISRSFADEFLNAVNELKTKKAVIKIINLKPQFKKLINRVRKTKEEIKKELE